MHVAEEILQSRLFAILDLFPFDIQIHIDINCEVHDGVIYYRLNIPCRRVLTLFSMLFRFGDHCDSFACRASSVAINYNHLDGFYGVELSFCLFDSEKECQDFLDIHLPNIISLLKIRRESAYPELRHMCGLEFLKFERYIRIRVRAKHESLPRNHMRILASLIYTNLKDRVDQLKDMTVELTSEREIRFHLLSSHRDWIDFFLHDPMFTQRKYLEEVNDLHNSLDDLM